MAWLGEETAADRAMTDTVEEALYRHRQPLLGELSVAFFDTTSLYFEGDGAAPRSASGVIPRTSARNSPRSCLASCWTSRTGRSPSFLWPGNTADATSLLPVVERLRNRFGVERACIVADRGMISAATIAALEAQKIDYILGARERSSKEVRETVLHDDGATVPLTIPRQKGETEQAVKEVKIEGRRYIVTSIPPEKKGRISDHASIGRYHRKIFHPTIRFGQRISIQRSALTPANRQWDYYQHGA